MKKRITSLLFFAVFLIYSAQSKAQTNQNTKPNKSFSNSNLVKINLTALPLSTFSVQYERAVAKKISAGIGLRLMPEGSLPLKSLIESLINDDEAWTHVQNFRISNFALTPEARFYLGKSVFRGFYVAPFGRYASYTAKIPFEFEFEDPLTGYEEETIALEGRISSLTAGLMFGAQWKLSNLVYLDWWILGPHYGTANGDITGRKSLSQEEQIGLSESLSDLDDLPFVESHEVSSEGAKVNVKGPWGGIRAGIALGFRF